jgi:hypothetical protein
MKKDENPYTVPQNPYFLAVLTKIDIPVFCFQIFH